MEPKTYVTISTNEYFWAMATVQSKEIENKVLQDDIKMNAQILINNKEKITIRVSFKEYALNLGMTLENYVTYFKQKCDTKQLLPIMRKMAELVLFSRVELFLYIILYDYFLENEEKLENNFLTISLKEIHCMYRNHSLKRFGKIDEQTIKAYLKAFQNLSNKDIQINLPENTKFKRMMIHQKLIQYKILKNKNEQVTAVKYSLGDFGNYLKFTRKQCGLLPPTILHRGFNQVSMLYIAVYICRMVFMKRKSRMHKKEFSISVKTLLNNCMFYGSKGEITGKTYLKKLEMNTNSNTKVLNNFGKNLRQVLEDLKDYGVISQFSIGRKVIKKEGNRECVVYREEAITSKNYSRRDLQIHINL